jgi:signal transduction histidine kinase
MYDFMHHVSSTWHRLYWALMLVGSFVFVVAYGLFRFTPGLQHYGSTFAVSGTLAILAGAQIVYSLSISRLVGKRGETLATFVASMLFLLIILGGLTGTGLTNNAMPYVIGWYLIGLFSGIYGLPIALASIFLTAAYTLTQSHFVIGHIGTVGFALIGGNTILSVASYIFWRRRYDDVQSKTVSQLSTMLRSNQQQSEILIQSISDGLIVINTEGKITLMNPAAATMTEWPVSEASSVDVRLVVKLHKEHGEDIAPQDDPFVLVLNKKQRLSQTVQLTGRDSKKQIISLVVSPVLIPKTNAFVGAVAVMRDISDQQALEQQRGEFISTAAHEMRTPVAAIEGYLALALNEKVSTIDVRARSYLEKAHASTQHLGKLFQDLLTSSKAEDGRLSSHPVVVEVSAFLQQLTDDLRFAAEKKGLFVDFVIGSSDDTIDATAKDVTSMHMVKPLYYVVVDPDRMREVVTNLFDNACKYTEQGKVSVGLTGNTDLVQLYIRDTGSGIPAEDIPHLFQKFYRVDNSATRTIGGTGLGLFISRKIVELYHGRIWVESTVGQGSTFFINLPRISTQKASEMQASELNSQNQVSSVGSSSPKAMVQ